ncbi:MAG: ChaN family lipoprotein [Pseudotabrizicola sp.]|uniref:ChaN family lipoprotein n=1 Tax=Pseudotabrizicola sp. TaxID=2939647 RepID=UPI00271B9FD4|nr:ChaN family lipoprotein [Pseudotabrizicola sp.]MDO9641004.1 ChaN family lipoprotein [Pseudotabrizicola sp.]
MTGSVWRDARGRPITFDALMNRAATGRVVLLGERHDRADHHRWQLHVAAALLSRRPVTLGFEMFPATANPVLAEWVMGGLSEDSFLDRSGWAKSWGFAADLYLPIFRFCREMRVPMVGLNVQRDLVRAVGADGWDKAPDTLKEDLTRPLPSSMAYRRFIFELTGGQRPGRKAQSAEDPAFDSFMRAQEVWDRAFATRLARVATADPARLAVGIIGMGHLQFGGGVSWQLTDLGIADSLALIPRDAGEVAVPFAADASMELPGRGDAP